MSLSGNLPMSSAEIASITCGALRLSASASSRLLRMPVTTTSCISVADESEAAVLTPCVKAAADNSRRGPANTYRMAATIERGKRETDFAISPPQPHSAGASAVQYDSRRNLRQFDKI